MPLSKFWRLEEYDYYAVLERVKAFHTGGFAAREDELDLGEE